MKTDPKLDLVLDRVVDVPPALVWMAWTRPEHLMKWFTPRPWTTVECEIDLRPGGVFRTVMRSPEGQDFPNIACILAVEPESALVWTTLMGPGFRPSTPTVPPESALGFTAVISMVAHGAGTKYTAHVMHTDPDTCRRHDTMGFRDGWGTAFDQLVALARTL